MKHFSWIRGWVRGMASRASQHNPTGSSQGNLAMRAMKQLLAWSAWVVVFSAAHDGLAQNWRPALHDADELYDAAEDLHDRAERFQDPHAMPVTRALEEVTTQLYGRLKAKACAAEIVPLLNTTEAILNEAASVVSLSCHLRTDRKALSELENARRYFAGTAEHIHCALRELDGPRGSAIPYSSQRYPIQHAAPLHSVPQYGFPTYGTPSYGLPQYGVPHYGVPQYLPAAPNFPHQGAAPWNAVPPAEYEVRRPNETSPGRALARVLISELLK